MSAVTRLTPPAVSAYAPGAATPHFSDVTVRAVDHIGNDTSSAIRQRAQVIMTEAQEVSDELNSIADEMDRQARAASEWMSSWCLKMSTARAVAGDLRQISAQDDGEPSPRFLHSEMEA